MDALTKMMLNAATQEKDRLIQFSSDRAANLAMDLAAMTAQYDAAQKRIIALEEQCQELERMLQVVSGQAPEEPQPMDEQGDP